MDQKTWLWRKRSSEKTIVANGDQEEKPVPVKKEADLETSFKAINEKLAAVVDECSAKDTLVESYRQMADDAIADKNKAEEEVRRLREELDTALEQRATASDRLTHLNAALKDCMDQLNHVRNEQEQRVHDAVMKSSQEFEKERKKLEERLVNAMAESTYLSKALLVKEKLIEDLNNVKNQSEAEFETLMSRLDSTEKENAFLRYEFRTLEKELDLRNEEVEYCHRSAEASNKQHLENIKKIKKLEGDCQRLRALTRKRMPGPGVLANIRSDIGMQCGIRRKSLGVGSAVRDSSTVYSPDSPSKKLELLINRLQELEKENAILKEFLAKKEEEILHYQKVKNSELTMVSRVPGDEFRDRKTEHECKMIGASDISLMDDFVEMEKLAIVAVDVPLGGSFTAFDVSRSLSDSSKEIPNNHMTKELVPVGTSSSPEKPSDWLQNVANAILEQHRISKRSVEDLLGDVQMALTIIDRPEPEPSEVLPISGYITWKSPTSTPRSNSIQEPSNEFLQPDAYSSLGKIIELVRKFAEDGSLEDDLSAKDSKSLPSKAADCKIQVFRWKSRELSTVLKDFLYSCNNVLDGKIGYEKFIGDLASTLGWIINSCVSYEDDSTVRDEFRKHLGGEGPGTALELECVQNLMLKMETMHSFLQAEISGLKNEFELLGNDLDMAHKLKQAQEIIKGLQKDLEVLKESRGMTEDQIESLKAMNEDLDTQLTVTKSKLNEVLQKLSCVEVELENKNHCCEELEGTCLELQLQLESMNKNSEGKGNEEQLLQTGMEITKASAKLAECEETILKLGKQLKGLGSARELSVVDRVLSMTSTTTKKLKQRTSLREQLLSEDNAKHLKYSREIIRMADANGASSLSRTSSHNFSFPDSQVSTMEKCLRTRKDSKTTAKPGALVVMPTKKRGGGINLLTKLLLRRKKGSRKNNSNSNNTLW